MEIINQLKLRAMTKYIVTYTVMTKELFEINLWFECIAKTQEANIGDDRSIP
jgi:hypothetical protein